MLDDKLRKVLIFSGLGLSISASAAALYFLLKNDDENDGLETNVVTGSRQTTIKVSVPRELVGAIIGRQGAVIKNLQSKTNTRIRFDDKGEFEDLERVITIRGTPENAQEAETLIRELIENQPETFLEEIFIPARACGRIIGKNGSNIRHMTHVSKAKICLESSSNNRDPDDIRRVTIRGTRDQIAMAINMIDEALAEDEAIRQKVELYSAGRPSRYKGKPLSLEAASGDHYKDSDAEMMQEKLTATSADGFMEVYISAVNNISQFWVQLVGIKSVELDKLVENMTDFYDNPLNRNALHLSEVKVGLIIAAPFLPDKSWYRARVIAIEDDEYNPSQSKVSVYYVDFGDSAILQRNSLCQISQEFMAVPFQAIECKLANIKPIDGQQWNDESKDIFEELTYSAQWKVIMAKQHSQLKNDSSPCLIDLVDTNGLKDVNVAEELVNRKLAAWDRE